MTVLVVLTVLEIVVLIAALAFPDATLAADASAGRRWGYSGIELRLIDGELIDPSFRRPR